MACVGCFLYVMGFCLLPCWRVFTCGGGLAGRAGGLLGVDGGLVCSGEVGFVCCGAR